MNNFFISGIQQIGIGTSDFRATWNWMIENFGFDVRILEDDTIAERMLPYTGNKPQKRHACIAMNLQGGGGAEIWQYSERKPRAIGFEPKWGDLGILAAKIKCRDVEAYHNAIMNRVATVSNPSEMPDGTKCMLVQDPQGNIFHVVEDKSIYIEQGKQTGGMVGAVIGVTDMEQSVKFYQTVLGYDQIVYDKTGMFSDLALMDGGHDKYRRVLLKTGKCREGAFAKVFGESTIELIQALEREPKKLYEGRYWGDPGFIQLCLDVHNMDELGKFCAKNGHPFTVDSCPNGEIFDMGDASGRFTYIEDPDGTLIEFVETYKIPLVKKLGLNINMSKRDARKPLPKILFKVMNLVAKENIK